MTTIPASEPVRSAARDRMMGLEQTLVRVRWIGIAIGVLNITFYIPDGINAVPPYLRPVGLTLVTALALVNAGVMQTLRSGPSERTLRILGRLVFVADLTIVWGIVYLFTFERFGATWVVLTTLALEGALRYEMRGAMTPALLALVLEPAREVYGSIVYEHGIFYTSMIFRVGMITIIAMVAGAMARNLQRERAQAERRAVELQELAEREQQARVEIDAFQQVILAGAREQTVTTAMESMLARIGSDLGYERIALLLLDDGNLQPVAMRGFPSSLRGEIVSVDEGVVGMVVRTRRAAVIADVRTDADYYRVDESTRSQVTVPVWSGDEVIGVLDAESPRVGAFTWADAERLERLGRQMALIVENARLLARERATVERLRDLDTMKSDFVAIASHELRTPLTSMNGVIKTLRRADLDISPEQTEEFLAILDRQSDRLTRLVEDLLIVSRIDAGGVGVRVEAVRLDAVLADVLTELGARADRVSVSLPTPAPTLLSDGQRIGQIVRNLVENAIKFSPDDTLVRVCGDVKDDVVVIDVADDGPGIPDEELARIFDRFHQVGGSLGRRGDGFGLGLYITKRLTEALGGSVDVRSEVGRGTTFSVRLPGRSTDAVADPVETV